MQKKHFNEICESFSRCISIEECPKRHTQICRRFNSGKECIFKEDCSYTHIIINPDEENNVFNEKVEVLEKTVTDLTKKLEAKKLVQL